MGLISLTRCEIRRVIRHGYAEVTYVPRDEVYISTDEIVSVVPFGLRPTKVRQVKRRSWLAPWKVKKEVEMVMSDRQQFHTVTMADGYTFVTNQEPPTLTRLVHERIWH